MGNTRKRKQPEASSLIKDGETRPKRLCKQPAQLRGYVVDKTKPKLKAPALGGFRRCFAEDETPLAVHTASNTTPDRKARKYLQENAGCRTASKFAVKERLPSGSPSKFESPGKTIYYAGAKIKLDSLINGERTQSKLTLLNTERSMQEPVATSKVSKKKIKTALPKEDHVKSEKETVSKESMKAAKREIKEYDMQERATDVAEAYLPKYKNKLEIPTHVRAHVFPNFLKHNKKVVSASQRLNMDQYSLVEAPTGNAVVKTEKTVDMTTEGRYYKDEKGLSVPVMNKHLTNLQRKDRVLEFEITDMDGKPSKHNFKVGKALVRTLFSPTKSDSSSTKSAHSKVVDAVIVSKSF